RLPLRGQVILEPVPLGAHVDALEDLVVDQMLEARREDVLGDPEAALEVAETSGAEEGVSDDEERPPVAEGLERLGDPAVNVGEALPPHGRSIAVGKWLDQATK